MMVCPPSWALQTSAVEHRIEQLANSDLGVESNFSTSHVSRSRFGAGVGDDPCSASAAGCSAATPATSHIINPSMTSVAGRRVRTATSDTIESFLLKVLLYGVGFGASIIISRGLGPSGRGIYYLPVVTAATVAAFGTLGMEQANVFLFGSRGVPIARLWAQGGMVALILGLLGGILLVSAPSLLPETFGTTPTMLWWIAAIGLPFALHTQFSAGLLTLRGDVTWQFRAGVVSAVLQVVSLIGLYAAGLFTPLTVLVVTVSPARRRGYSS